jgi:hypothetical protein
MLRHRGLSEAQTSALLAAYELACRLARRRISPRRPLSRPDLVAHFLALRYQLRDQEVMGALFLDRHHGLLGETEIFRGTLHRVAVEPRQILRQCLLRGGAAVVVFHARPSGTRHPASRIWRSPAAWRPPRRSSASTSLIIWCSAPAGIGYRFGREAAGEACAGSGRHRLFDQAVTAKPRTTVRC